MPELPPTKEDEKDKLKPYEGLLKEMFGPAEEPADEDKLKPYEGLLKESFPAEEPVDEGTEQYPIEGKEESSLGKLNREFAERQKFKSDRLSLRGGDRIKGLEKPSKPTAPPDSEEGVPLSEAELRLNSALRLHARLPSGSENQKLLKDRAAALAREKESKTEKAIHATQFRFLTEPMQKAAQDVGVGGSTMVGMKWGIDAAKLIPHPLGKALAIPLGSLAGYGLGKGFFKGEALTKGEIAEQLAFGAATVSVIQQVRNLGPLRGFLVGGAEASVIAEVGSQVRARLDTGKPSPIGTEEFYWKHALSFGLGGAFGAGMAGKRPMPLDKEYAQFKSIERRQANVKNQRGLIGDRQARIKEQRRIIEDRLNTKDRAEDLKAGDRKELAEMDKRLAKVDKEFAALPKRLAEIDKEFAALPQGKEFRERMADEWMDTLGRHWTRWDSIAKNRTNTRGERNQAREIARTLKRDIGIFHSNWEQFTETALQKPEWFTRLSLQMRQARAIDESPAAKKGIDNNEGLREVMGVIDGFSKPSKLGREKALNHALSTLGGRKTAGKLDPTFNIGPALQRGPQAYWASQTRVMREAAQASAWGKGGQANLHPAWKLADKIENAIDDGQAMSAAGRVSMSRKARELGRGTTKDHVAGALGRGNTARQAEKEFEEFMHIAHNGKMPDGRRLKQDVRVDTNKDAKRKIAEAKESGEAWAFPLKKWKDKAEHLAKVTKAFEDGKPIPIDVLESYPKLAEKYRKLRGWDSQLNQQSIYSDDIIGAVNIRDKEFLIEARRYYDKASPQARAMIDGYRDAQNNIGNMMSRDKVLILDPSGKGGHYFDYDGTLHFGRELKPPYLDALRNLDVPKLSSSRKAAIEEILEINGLKDSPESRTRLKEIYKSFIDTTELGTSSGSTAKYSGIEVARKGSDIPPDMYDMSWSGRDNYVDRAYRRLAEIQQLGQEHTLVNGKVVPNENSSFSLARKAAGANEDTKKYLDGVWDSMFKARNPNLSTVHSLASLSMIANPSSAIKNSTGILKIWALSNSKHLPEALGKAIRERTSKTFSNVPDNVAEEMGILGDRVSAMTQLLDPTAQTGFRGGIQKATGAGMKIMGFTPVENLVRQTAFYDAEYSLLEFTKLFKGNKNARKIIDLEERMKLLPSAENKAALKQFQSKDDKALREYIRLYQTLNLDVKKLASESMRPLTRQGAKAMGMPAGEMEEVRRLYQRMVNRSQGGYNAATLPQHMVAGETYRFVQKFSSWTKQMMDMFEQNISSEAKQGNFKPLAKWVGGSLAASEMIPAFGELAGFSQRKGPTWSEIKEAIEDNDPEHNGGKLLLERFMYGTFYAGMATIPTDILVRKKVTSELGWGSGSMFGPIADQVSLGYEAFNDYLSHGSEAKLAKDFSRLLSGPRRIHQLATKGGLLGEDKKRVTEMERIASIARDYSQRFLEHPNTTPRQKLPSSGTLDENAFTAGERYDFNTKIRNLLLLGKGKEAEQIASDWTKAFIDESNAYGTSHTEKILRKLGASIKKRRPLAGKDVPDSHIGEFKEWIRKYQGEDELYRIERADEIYMRAARRAKLIPPIKVESPEEKAAFFSKNAETAIRKTTEAWVDRWYEDNAEGASEGTLIKKLDEDMRTAWRKDLKPEYVYKDPKTSQKYIDAQKRLKLGQALLMRKYKVKGQEESLMDYALAEEFLDIKNESKKIKFLIDKWDAKGADYETQREHIIEMRRRKLLTDEDVMAYESFDQERKERDKKK